MAHSLLSPKADHEARLLKHALKTKAIYKEVDGYYVIWMQDMGEGAWSSYDLKTLAKILDDANRLWDEQVRRDLS